MNTPRVYIVDGARTPFLKVSGEPGPFSPVDLAVQCSRPLLLRQPFPLDSFDRVILGCVNVVADEMNPARLAALRLGLGEATVAFTVQINCGSGMQSIDTGYRYIRDGACDLVLAGGTEALSHAPLLFRDEAVAWFAEFNHAEGLTEKAQTLTSFRPNFFIPTLGLEQGLTDAFVGLNMGQTAELLAHIFDIRRDAADRYALESHERLAQAQDQGWLDGEVQPAYSSDGTVFQHDDGVRRDTSLEKLATLKPVFEPPWGQVTAGNSSQVTDGASWVILASEAAVEQYGLSPLAEIKDTEWAALDPSIMGLGPVLSATPLLKRHGYALDEIDLWEINEAFGAQVLSCLAAWQENHFCKEILGLDAAMGEIDRDRLNVDGGAISLGHPVGASGNRIVLHLANALRRRGRKRGIATECIGGGQAGAMLIEIV